MEHYEERFQTLQKIGMVFRGVKKDFKGNVDRATFFSVPGLVINTFGYYRNDDGTWNVFVTDNERGIHEGRGLCLPLFDNRLGRTYAGCFCKRAL